ncbi:MAG: hypothetical protein HY077_06665 [Elusimicrobia bacterium]|nr:hypothetical protein [Elusimicrobiota bacterium]
MKVAAPNARQAPAAAPDAWLLRAAGAAVFVLLALYLGFPDKVYVFDGIMFSGVIERAVDEWRREVFNRRHLLFNPFVMGLRDALALVGLPTRAYVLIQRINAVFGLFGAAVYFRLLFRLTRDRALAALGAAALAVSFSYWSRATEGQVYMMMTFWALAAGACALSLAEEGTPTAAGLLGGSLVTGVLFHAADAALVPMAAAAVWAAWRGRRGRPAWWLAPALALGVAAPYALAFRLGDARSLFAFFSEAADVHATSGGGWSHLLGFFAGRGLPVADVLAASLLAVAACPWAARLPAVAGGGALAASLLGASVWLWRRRPARRAQLVILALWGGLFVVLDAFWHGGVYFWTVPCAAGIAVLALAAREAFESGPGLRPPTLCAGALAVACLGAWNFGEGILPQSKLENNVGYQRSLFVRDHTVASSWIILSGLGFPNAKVYLPYFAHRTREVLEYYLDRYPRLRALGLFSEFVRRNHQAGVPLYLLSDMVDDQAVIDKVQKTWGVSQQDVRNCFGPGRLLLMAQQDPLFRIFLFVPAEHADLLFAALSYSVLTESEMTRLKETAWALQEIGRGMSQSERRAVPRVMKETDYGAQLLYRGFVAYMNPESERAARERMKRYDQWQKTPDFHLRLGNLYQYLGLADEVRREWTIAYEGSRDPEVLANIKKLPR